MWYSNRNINKEVDRCRNRFFGVDVFFRLNSPILNLENMRKMPERRRTNREPDSSCCCVEHQYLCPDHRDNESDTNLSCLWLECKKPVIAMFAVVICAAIISYFFQQSDALAEMRYEMQELKMIVENQKALLDSIQEGKTQIPPNDKAVKEIVRKEIDSYDADKIAQVDYALESAGGKILSILTTKPYISDQSVFSKIYGKFMTSICKDGNADTARPILQPKMAPGECWAFEGSQGSVMIKLLARIFVKGITIEHIPAAISPSSGITSAPKIFNLWGLKCKDDTNAFLFGEFTYKNDTPIQYFDVPHQSNTPYNIVLVKILSNWGNPQYTCVYRVRIHGDQYKTNY